MRIPVRNARRRRWLLGGAVMAAGGCGGEATPPAPSPTPQPADNALAPETTTRGGEATPGNAEPTSSALAASVVELALASIGSPYRWGGTGGNGFDCSGLIQFAYAEHGVGLPRVSREQIRAGVPVEPIPSRLRPADILGFSRDHGGDISHVGLYVGGDEFIHSSTTGVRVSRLSNPYWQVRLVAVRRVLD